ncbi:NAD-P-binding protein [Mycena crocata]|nr:NAD-P-binding protein [Mycena crocata]
MTQPNFSFTTTAEEVATAFADEIKGKNVVVTGTSLNGIGFETAAAIAKYANLVIITGHNAERLRLAEEAIRKQVPSADVRPLIVDLSSLAAVRKAAAEVNAYAEPLHVLIHNAAAPVGEFKLTADNLESQMVTSYIGPFLFTKLLAPKLLATGTAQFTPRVVFVSSIGHSFCSGVNFDTLGHPDPALYNNMDAYNQAKAASVTLAIEISKRSKGGINGYSLHPGAIYTNIMQNNPEAIVGLQKLGALLPDGKPNPAVPFKTIAQGAATTVVAAFDPRLNDKPGSYLDNCKAANELINPACTNSANAEKLWTLTEQIIGETFIL